MAMIEVGRKALGAPLPGIQDTWTFALGVDTMIHEWMLPSAHTPLIIVVSNVGRCTNKCSFAKRRAQPLHLKMLVDDSG